MSQKFELSMEQKTLFDITQIMRCHVVVGCGVAPHLDTA